MFQMDGSTAALRRCGTSVGTGSVSVRTGSTGIGCSSFGVGDSSTFVSSSCAEVVSTSFERGSSQTRPPGRSSSVSSSFLRIDLVEAFGFFEVRHVTSGSSEVTGGQSGVMVRQSFPHLAVVVHQFVSS